MCVEGVSVRCSAVGVRSRAPTYDDTPLTRQGHQRRRDPVVAEQPQRYVREYTVVARRPDDGAIRRPRHLRGVTTNVMRRGVPVVSSKRVGKVPLQTNLGKHEPTWIWPSCGRRRHLNC